MNRNLQKTILIVDDDRDDREVILQGFIESNCEEKFIEFENGFQVIQFLESIAPGSDYPSLILLDLNMPIIGGIEVIRHIRSSIYSYIPIIVISTTATEIEKKNGYSMGCGIFIKKPNRFSEMIDIAKAIAVLFCLKTKVS